MAETTPLSGGSTDIEIESYPNQHGNINNNNSELSSCKCTCNHNIYNAFLIANYRKDLKFKKNEFVSRDIQYGLGFLAYLTAFVQYAALITLISTFIAESDVTFSQLGDFSPWAITSRNPVSLLLWPFFMITSISTCMQVIQVEIDINALHQWNITTHKMHVILLKLIAERFLYTVGSCAYYLSLSWYARNANFLDLLLKLLAFQFIFEADEWSFNLVKNIIQQRMLPNQFDSFFEGTAKDKIFKYEMVTYITLPLSLSLMIQGVYSRSWIILSVGFVRIPLWCIGVSYKIFAQLIHKNNQNNEGYL